MCVCSCGCHGLVAKLCPTLFDPMDCSPPGSSVHGILQARILQWVSISFSRGIPDPGIKLGSPALADGFFTTEPAGKPYSTGCASGKEPTCQCRRRKRHGFDPWVGKIP